MQQADDRVHFTHLRQFANSAAHYRASVDEGFDSKSYSFGRLAHFLSLGGVLGEHYLIWDRLTDDGKTAPRRGKFWDAFVGAAKTKGIKESEIFTAKELSEATPVAQAVRDDEVVQRLGLLEGANELMLDWDNKGVPFRSHIDKLGVASAGERKGRRHLVDLKTTTCSNPEKFRWEMLNYAYHAQMATYEDAVRSIGQEADDVYILAVEKEPPYCVVVYKLGPRRLEKGRRLMYTWLEEYRRCSATNVWPGYTLDVVEAEDPEVEVKTALPAKEPLSLIMHDGSELTVSP